MRIAGKTAQRGFSMVEILVTLVILSIGLLGLAGLIIQSQRAQFESFQRAQALTMLEGIAARIGANRTVADCYAITDAAVGAPFFGVGSTAWPACGSGSVAAYTTANADMAEIDAILKGESEKSGTQNVGGMIGARACVHYYAPEKAYIITVAWLGPIATFAPHALLTCGLGAYGPDEARRRVVTTSMRIGRLE